MTISLLKEKSTCSTSSFNLSNLNSSNSNTTPIVTSGIVFIDPKVDDYEMLMAGVKPGLEVVLLDGSHNGIAQITQALNRHRGLSSLHIVAHGEAGSLWLGNGLVNSNTLDQPRDDLHSWATALAPDADILLYGCKVAAGEKGQHFVQLLSQLVGADVAASNNLTGSAALGGDWELEVKIGNVEAPIAFGAEIMKAYNAVLTTRRVSVGTGGTQANGHSSTPSISADGRYVAFQSLASNLVSGDTNGKPDVFVYDIVSNTTRRVSVDSNGTQGNNSSPYIYSYLSISADGSYVAFMSDASNLVSGDTNNTNDIFVYDRTSGTENPWTGTPGNDTYTYTGTANFTGKGLAGNDTIVGGIANDILDGGTGNDSLTGGKGNDAYYVDSTGDIVTENPNEGTDTVYTSILNGYTLGANLENLTLLEGARSSYGNSLNNIINGNAGRNYLDGGTGNDTINGAGGNDNIVGGYGNDSLLGGQGNDYLVGSQDNDYLSGGDGNDILEAYGGTLNEVDTLSGGAGADIFRLGYDPSGSVIFYRGNGNSYAIIADFSRLNGDKIDILGSSSNISQYSFTQSGADTQISYKLDGDLMAVVQNTIATSFTQSDFI